MNNAEKDIKSGIYRPKDIEATPYYTHEVCAELIAISKKNGRVYRQYAIGTYKRHLYIQSNIQKLL